LSSKLASTGIVARNYNSRGLITHNADTRPLVRQSDGTLWAFIRENTTPNYFNLYRSTDGGFSWQRQWSGGYALTARKGSVAGLNTNGPHISLQVYEDLDQLIAWVSYFDSGAGTFDCEPFSWALSDPKTRQTAAPYVGTVGLHADALALDAPYTTSQSFLITVSASNLVVETYRPLYQTTSEHVATKTGSFFDLFQGCAHEDGYVDIAILEETTTPSYALRHIRYRVQDAFQGTFETKHTIVDPGVPDDIVDIGIARDGYGTLCAVWGQATPIDDNMDFYFALSVSQGATWTEPQKISKEVGHSVYRDPATARHTVRARVLGGQQGFMLSYCHNNPSVIPKTFVRTLFSSDGIDYVVGEQREIATQVALPDEPVTGLSWFRPPAGSLLDFTDPGLVRVAYQVGEGNSRVQTDTVPVRVGQELLFESAYPSSLSSQAGSYVIEMGNPFQVPVMFNILGAPNENLDYYAVGLIGHTTKRYMAAFNKIGTEYRFQRFDPLRTAEMNDRSAFKAPVELTSLAVLDPQTYEFPTFNQRGSDSFTTAIERDIRKLFLPPSMHLGRDFIINKGNFLKRTVWIVSFDGNEYEISQIVPYFIDGVICYYGANAFVVGPSNDPFSRPVLPSET
jgi:hypothetical protein